MNIFMWLSLGLSTLRIGQIFYIITPFGNDNFRNDERWVVISKNHKVPKELKDISALCEIPDKSKVIVYLKGSIKKKLHTKSSYLIFVFYSKLQFGTTEYEKVLVPWGYEENLNDGIVLKFSDFKENTHLMICDKTCLEFSSSFILSPFSYWLITKP